MCPGQYKNTCVPAAPAKLPKGEAAAEEAAGAVPVEAPPNIDGLAASPVFAAEPNPKLGVDDAPAAAPPPPKSPPVGLLAAGVPDAAPPNRPEPPEPAPAPPPNSPEPPVLDPAAVEPKMDGDEAPVVLLAPPKSPPAGLEALAPALLPLGCANVKPDILRVRLSLSTREREWSEGNALGCWLLHVVAVYFGAKL